MNAKKEKNRHATCFLFTLGLFARILWDECTSEADGACPIALGPATGGGKGEMGNHDLES